MYVVLAVALLSLTGAIGLAGVSAGLLLLAQAMAFLLGIGHAYLLYRFIPQLDADRFVPGLLATLLLTLGGVLAIIACYWGFFPAANYAFSACAVPFAVPYLFVWVYRYYLSIPAPDYKKWYYPLGKPMPDLDLVDLSRVLVIQFVFFKKTTDSTPTNFKAKAPAQMTMGELFLIFLNDYNEQNATGGIQFLDEKNMPTGWHFYYSKSRFSGRHYFDPELSFQQNNVSDNFIITAERSR